MNPKIDKLFKLIKDMLDNKKSVQLRINLHEGNLSDKIEIKESLSLNKG
jgi:hypothetical protein